VLILLYFCDAKTGTIAYTRGVLPRYGTCKGHKKKVMGSTIDLVGDRIGHGVVTENNGVRSFLATFLK